MYRKLTDWKLTGLWVYGDLWSFRDPANVWMCGAIEDVQHFLLECPNYHVPRETLRQSLLLRCGIADFDTEILLSVTDDEDLKDIRPLIWDQLDMYITQTKRF